MSALTYLWRTLLKRRLLHCLRNLRRPAALLGFAALAALLGFLFYYRKHEFFGGMLRRETLVLLGLIMACGSLFKGFQQRGLPFDLPDLEFLFTSPFTQRQIILYRLFPNYLFAALQGMIFWILFDSHLRHPLLATAGVILFQVVCFHLSTAASIFATTLSDCVHHRVRWMMVGIFFLIAALYLRLAWDFKLIPSFLSLALSQFLFYPAVTLGDISVPPMLATDAAGWLRKEVLLVHELYQPLLLIGILLAGAAATLHLLLRMKADIFESSFAATNTAAEKQVRRQKGHATVLTREPVRSASLPRLRLFHGVGAILWKNLMVARRCRRELALAFALTLIYTGFLTALLLILRRLSGDGGAPSLSEARGFTSGIAMAIAALAFFLQRMLPFDFRRDGFHLLNFRALPVGAVGVALMEVSLPTIFCLAFQLFGIIPLIFYGYLDWPTLLVVVLSYPAIALGLNAVWNLHYLFSAAKRAANSELSETAAGKVLVVAFSFLVFYPAGWVIVYVANHLFKNETYAFALAAACGLVVQYSINALLILAIAALFRRFEISGDLR